MHTDIFLRERWQFEPLRNNDRNWICARSSLEKVERAIKIGLANHWERLQIHCTVLIHRSAAGAILTGFIPRNHDFVMSNKISDKRDCSAEDTAVSAFKNIISMYSEASIFHSIAADTVAESQVMMDVFKAGDDNADRILFRNGEIAGKCHGIRYKVETDRASTLHPQTFDRKEY
jgi:hypothetical protein